MLIQLSKVFQENFYNVEMYLHTMTCTTVQCNVHTCVCSHYAYVHTVWLQISWDNIFLNFSNALRILKILASKILVLCRCSPYSYVYMNISRQCQRAPHCYQVGNFPVAASSTCNTHDSVSIPSNPVYPRVYVFGYPARNLL